MECDCFARDDIRKIRIYKDKRMTEFSQRIIESIDIETSLFMPNVFGVRCHPNRYELSINLCLPLNGHSKRRLTNLRSYMGGVRVKVKLINGEEIMIKDAKFNTIDKDPFFSAKVEGVMSIRLSIIMNSFSYIK